MRRKYPLVLLITLVLYGSCCSKKELLSYSKPIIYKLITQRSTYYTEKRISFWKQEWIKHTRSIDSTHFIYQNFETFYVFSPDKVVKQLELRNSVTKDLLTTYKNQDGRIGRYTNCFLKIGGEKLVLEKKGLDTLVLIDQVRNIESILVRIAGKD